MIQRKNSCLVVIINNRGEMALQKRADDESAFPGHWDFSAGGGISKNEDPEKAAKREALEELGIEVSPEFIGKESFSYTKTNGIDIREGEFHIFKAKHDGPFKVRGEEVGEIKFFSPEEIKKMVSGGEKLHPSS